MIDKTELEVSDLENDLWVHINPLLTFKNHVRITVRKAQHYLKISLKISILYHLKYWYHYFRVWLHPF